MAATAKDLKAMGLRVVIGPQYELIFQCERCMTWFCKITNVPRDYDEKKIVKMVEQKYLVHVLGCRG